MKVFHRLRGRLLLLLVMAVVSSGPSPPPSFDLKNCLAKEPANYRCAVHDSCITDREFVEDKYRGFGKGELAKVLQCTRYIVVRAVSSDTVEIEFRDDTLSNAEGATVQTQGRAQLFGCKEAAGKMKMTTAFGANSGQPLTVTLASGTTLYSKLYCKVTLKAAAGHDIPDVIRDNQPDKINGKDVSGLELRKLEFECSWGELYSITSDSKNVEEFTSLEIHNQIRRCPATHFNWLKKDGEREFKRIAPDFSCNKLKIQYQETDIGLPINLNPRDQTKCSRPKCAGCNCPFCGGAGRPEFIESKGTQCTEIKCAKYMILTPEKMDPFIHPNASLHCFQEPGDHGEAKWGKSGREKEEGYPKIINATCIDEISCAVLSPITTDCTEAATKHEGMNCTLASLNGTGTESVCDAGHEIWYRAGPSGEPSKVTEFKCNALTGNWNLQPASEQYQKGSNVYCLKEFVDNGTGAHGRPSGASAGTIIGIIVGVCVALFIIVIVVVLCWRRNLLKKGNRDEMPSVSITGKKSKKKKGKKGSLSSTGSKTSEQISAPPPPPCPDSLNFAVEPEPSRPHSSAQPSSGGPASAPAVGPDTGKPDKPAELIDIKLESQKKDSTESRRVKPKDSDTTVANTVTGTSIASKAEPPKGADATDKNASARSDTGTGTGASGRKKKNKMELDKHGRGLTDDDDYNIDEGAKPINHEDKNKKPYKPAVDPNKQMINVTVTEDEDGKMKAKLKTSLF